FWATREKNRANEYIRKDRRLNSGSASLTGGSDAVLCTGFKPTSFEHGAAATLQAFDTDIGAGAPDAKLQAAAGMFPPHEIHLAHLDHRDLGGHREGLNWSRSRSASAAAASSKFGPSPAYSTDREALTTRVPGRAP